MSRKFSYLLPFSSRFDTLAKLFVTSEMGDFEADLAFLTLLLDFFLERDFPETQELHDFLLFVSLN